MAFACWYLFATVKYNGNSEKSSNSFLDRSWQFQKLEFQFRAKESCVALIFKKPICVFLSQVHAPWCVYMLLPMHHLSKESAFEKQLSLTIQTSSAPEWM